MITVIHEGLEYACTYRGHTMTLKYCPRLQHWEMYTDNAAVRAYRTLGVKTFASLEEVEARYKSWRGLCALVKLPVSPSHIH